MDAIEAEKKLSEEQDAWEAFRFATVQHQAFRSDPQPGLTTWHLAMERSAKEIEARFKAWRAMWP